jgi:hypothetical protein
MSVEPIPAENVEATVKVSETGTQESSRQASGDHSATLPEGKLLQAKVVSIEDGKMVLQVGDKQIQADAVKGVVVGQTVIIRLQGVIPNMLMEVITDRQTAEQHLAAALKTLMNTPTSNLDFWTNLKTNLASLTSLFNGNELKPELQKAIQQLQTLQQPIVLSSSSAELPAALQKFISSLGLDLEAMLKTSLAEGTKPEGLQNNIKALLAMISTGIAEQATELNQQPLQLTTSAKEAISQMLDLFELQLRQNLSTKPAVLAKALASIKQNAQALPQAGEAVPQQLENIVNNLRSLPSQEALQLPPSEKIMLQQQIEELAKSINERLLVTEEGKNIVEKLLLNTAGKAADNMLQRLESFQVINSHLAEKDQQIQLLFPLEILGEMTEVQVRQFLQQQEDKEDSLTIVVKLELESLGAIRMDALAQGSTLYCHVYVEKPELVAIVEELRLSFAEQLEARGMQLGQLVCKHDGEKIEKFSDLHEQVLSPGEGLIDFQV